ASDPICTKKYSAAFFHGWAARSMIDCPMCATSETCDEVNPAPNNSACDVNPTYWRNATESLESLTLSSFVIPIPFRKISRNEYNNRKTYQTTRGSLSETCFRQITCGRE